MKLQMAVNVGLLAGLLCLGLGCATRGGDEATKTDATGHLRMTPPAFTAGGIAGLEQEKATRSPTQQKIDSNIVLALRKIRGEPPFDKVTKLEPAIDLQQDGRVLVDLDAAVSLELLADIKLLGGTVLSSFEAARAIRALVPLMQMEALAARADVKFISVSALATTNPLAAPRIKPVDANPPRQ